MILFQLSIWRKGHRFWKHVVKISEIPFKCRGDYMYFYTHTMSGKLRIDVVTKISFGEGTLKYFNFIIWILPISDSNLIWDYSDSLKFWKSLALTHKRTYFVFSCKNQSANVTFVLKKVLPGIQFLCFHKCLRHLVNLCHRRIPNYNTKLHISPSFEKIYSVQQQEWSFITYCLTE